LHDIESKTAETEIEMLNIKNSATATEEQKYLASTLEIFKNNKPPELNELEDEKKIENYKNNIIKNLVYAKSIQNSKKTNILNEYIKNMEIYKSRLPKNPYKLVIFEKALRLYIKLVYDSTKKNI